MFEFNLIEELNMKFFHEYMNEYRRQIERGDIKEAYKGLMEYIMKLRLYQYQRKLNSKSY